MSDLTAVAEKLVDNGKGIMATDAGEKSMIKRFVDAGVKAPEPDDIRRYRDVLYTVKGLGKYVGGVIMRDEAIRESANDGRSFVDVLMAEGIVAGIKVDRGPRDMALFGSEKVTEGLDGLKERLEEYYALGARFTKWRAVISIGPSMPTRQNVLANAYSMAQFAAISQEMGMVPIVEPEVLMDGEHTLDKCYEVTDMVSRTMWEVLLDMRVNPSGMLYKTNMIVAGKNATIQAEDQTIANKTVEVLKKTVSVAVPGVVFLSGGQEAVAATRRLNEIARVGAGAPWRWTFSFERAFEEPAMKVWLGKDENKAAAQAELLKRAEMNSLASLGRYIGE